MKKHLILLACAALLAYSCVRVPITNRKQMNLLSEAELQGLSLTEYKDFLSKNTISSNAAQTQMVKSVGTKIANAVTTYLSDHNKSKRIAGFEWEFNLVDDPTVNAWCMPGGKVVVYSGLMPVAQDEDGLAVVMGHEISHAVARHGNERMSQQMSVMMAGMALGVALQNKSEETRNIFYTSYGLGSALGMLAYSRKHETEADKLGLVFMAMAGYDPNKAISFWERMSLIAGGSNVPTLLRTHPTDEQRIRDLKAWLPEAMKYYKPAK